LTLQQNQAGAHGGVVDFIAQGPETVFDEFWKLADWATTDCSPEQPVARP